MSIEVTIIPNWHSYYGHSYLNVGTFKWLLPPVTLWSTASPLSSLLYSEYLLITVVKCQHEKEDGGSTVSGRCPQPRVGTPKFPPWFHTNKPGKPSQYLPCGPPSFLTLPAPSTSQLVVRNEWEPGQWSPLYLRQHRGRRGYQVAFRNSCYHCPLPPTTSFLLIPPQFPLSFFFLRHTQSVKRIIFCSLPARTTRQINTQLIDWDFSAFNAFLLHIYCVPGT